MNHFSPCLLFLDSFLYISYVELADTEDKEVYQEFLIAKCFVLFFKSEKSKFCILFVSRNEKFIFDERCLRYSTQF